MQLQRTYYEVLGLPKTATPDEIRRRYHDLARRFHPDRAADKAVAERLFMQINVAYSVLGDPDRRCDYDAKLRRAGGKKLTGPLKSRNGSSRDYAPLPPRPPVSDQERCAAALREARTLLDLGALPIAYRLCQEVIKAEPGNIAAYVLCGDIYVERCNWRSALSEYENAMGLGDQSLLLQEKIKRAQRGLTRNTPSGHPFQHGLAG